ncbi:MAG: MarR family transcriptional regulator [Nitriliruptorales bacterium]|nr:MarR family transcriptional regulator [Nitriliruptorales bacterium]
MVATNLLRPRGHVAPDTHPVELQRLAYQEATHDECHVINVQTLVWLFRAFNAVLNAQAEELRPLGLSPSAFNVLMALHNTQDRVLEPCQLAQRLLISRPSVTGLLDTLQAKRLIERDPHPEDRRRVLVRLTDEGLALLESHFDIHYSEQNAVFADLTADEKATLVALLRRVRGAQPEDLGRVDAAPG